MPTITFQRRRSLAVSTRTPHQGRVLAFLRDHGPTPRTRLSEELGVSPSTITKTVAPLLAAGLVEEGDSLSTSRVGRRAVAVATVPNAVTVCGVQLSAGLVRVGLSDANTRVSRASHFEFDPALPARAVLDGVADMLEPLLAAESTATCIGIGIGVPGTVDEEHRLVRLLVSMEWQDVPVSDYLEDRLGIPVVVEHNVRSMALAEALYGNHGTNTLAYFYVRNGVGLGLAYKGRSFYGGADRESYIGHTRVAKDGLRCTCGAHGCLETMVAEPYLRRALATLGGEDPRADVFEIIRAQIAAGNEHVSTLQDQLLEYLATAIASTVNLFTPDLVLVGGILSTAPKAFISELRERVRDRIFQLMRDDFRLESTDSGDEAGVSGGAAFALESFYYAG